MKRIAFLTVCLLTFGIRSNADDEIKAKVVNVLDGNTLEVKTGNDTYKIVLAGIDCG